MERSIEHTRARNKLAEKLKNQIVKGCGEYACIGIFCKVSDAELFAEEIAQMLLEYDTYFVCSSMYLTNETTVHYMLQDKKKAYRMSLHTNLSTGTLPTYSKENTMIEKEKTKTNSQNTDHARTVLKYLHSDLEAMNNGMSAPGSPRGSAGSKRMESTKTAAHNSTQKQASKTKDTLHTSMAQIVHMKKSKMTSIILQSMFYHELNKIRVSYTTETAVRIVKLFNSVKESVKFEKKYFIRFLSSIQELCSKSTITDVLCMERCNRAPGGLSYNKQNECEYIEEEEFHIAETLKMIKTPQNRRIIEQCVLCSGSLAECEMPQCDALCYTSAKLCVNELIDLCKSLIIVIDNTSVTNMREGTLLIAILKTLKQLYEFAVLTGAVHHSVFVNKRFSRLLNYKVEVKYHKEGMPSILDYPFILDMAAKSDLIQIENTERMKAELQDAFFRSLFVGKIPPYLTFVVNRESIVQDSLRILQTLEIGMVWKQLKIKFEGEDGIDSGGIKKEFFQILSQKTLEEWDIFEERNGCLWIKAFAQSEMDTRLSKYYLLGQILGLAAYNGAVLCFYFPNVFYKKVLGYVSTFEDLRQIDPSLYTSLKNMRNMTADEIADLYLEFPNADGDGKNVTKNNLEQFIRAYHTHVLDTLTGPAFNSIRNGLWSICGDTFIRSLLPCELSILIGGMECQNLEEIEKYTVYNGYRRDSELVQHFWDIFRAYDVQMQKKFLRFVTGSDRTPSGGLSRMALVFMRNGGDTERLPSSQTCFNTFLIPEYATKEKLKKKLDLAITYTEGFFLL